MAVGAMRDWDSEQFPDTASLSLYSPRNGWNGSSPKIPSDVSAAASNQAHTQELQSPASGHHDGLCVFCAHFLDAPLKNAVADVLHSLSRQVLDASAEAPAQTPGQSMTLSAIASCVSVPRSPAISRHSLSSEMTDEGEQVPCDVNESNMLSCPWEGDPSSPRHHAEAMSDSEWPEPEFEKRTRKRRDWTAVEDRRLRQLVEAFLRSLANRSATPPRKQLGPHLTGAGESGLDPVTLGPSPSSSSSLKSRIPWTRIASQMPGRSAARCRERYRNYLDPSIRHEPFTAKEDAIILREYQKRGAAWAYIASKLFGRSENAVKNRLHSLLRRARHSTAAPITTSAPTLA
ncbi:hypothetical protein F1559_001545 [Cyanidiococcus yangmingshanensis]|uniref:Uncharacterized protein n=1 Tax=Cyanidiococcus yangmingshanensis TaxID=2690220 RepID=A0A7J7ICM1_9RHOD|nr:hypothetical protein F1559_001545 [Cyanidiococcus yangmingshanensis]